MSAKPRTTQRQVAAKPSPPRRKKPTAKKPGPKRPAKAEASVEQAVEPPDLAHKNGDAVALQSLLAESFSPKPARKRKAPARREPELPAQTTTEPTKTGVFAALRNAAGSRWTSRITKSLIGLVLLAATVWVPASRIFQASSAEAVVNARIVTLRAPIEGDVGSDIAKMALGDELAAGTKVVEISNPRVDHGAVSDAARAVADSLDRQAQVIAQITALTSQKSALETQVETFRQSRIALLRARLRNGGNAQSNFFKNADELEIELAALQKGVFIGDSYNDKPSSAQRLDQIAIELDGLKSQLKLLRERHPRLLAAENEARAYYDQESKAQIAVQSNSQVWEILTTPGEHVAAGQPILTMLDCSRAIVTAAVSEAVYNSLSVGSKASFTFREGGDPIAGHVVQLTGLGTASSNFAILPSVLQLESYRVAIALPHLGGPGGCAVGRTGRVVFGPGS